MKAYVITTGIVFALVTLAHVLRLIAEGTGPLLNPWFGLTTALAVFLSGWAWRVFRTMSRPVKKA